jgi:hypothetical protein
MHNRFVIVVTGVVVIVLVGITIWFAWPQGGTKVPPSTTASSTSSTTVDTSGWNTYTSAAFGFSFKYPTTWQKSNDILSIVNPHIFFGNPLSGLETYSLRVFVLSNPQNLPPKEFVQQMLADDQAQDASNTAQGPAPLVTPQFEDQYELTVAGHPAYELYGVFLGDEHAEEVYVQQNTQMLEFVFPAPSENPNLSDPINNNVTARAIVNTLQLDANAWKFCGGIAAGAFPCASGYSCHLDGSYPDAGGHCVKQ